ncbi:hypothetical protein EYF80_064438 [Liparis tanakae]|uniref:Uncharacterized protein n=1 Tax=Liparis tanakae TaxID=230148 RepID=A0A4Z2EAZ6_9TELE|nr:hypothetical protein EYF80_064438 [Liparis tanakae]
MKREITSHPTPSLLNYDNLTHMGRPLWRSAGEEGRCVGERGSLRSLILPRAEVQKDGFAVRLPSECSPGAC